MQSIQDAQGDAWDIVIDLDAMERVKAEIDVDLGDTTRNNEEEADIYKLLQDYVLTGKILRSLCRLQMRERKIDDKGFNARFSTGELLVEAAKKIWAELADFFPPDRRSVFNKIVKMQIETSDRAYAEIDKVATEEELDAAMKGSLDSASEDLRASLEFFKSGGRSADLREYLESRRVR